MHNELKITDMQTLESNKKTIDETIEKKKQENDRSNVT